MNASAEHPITPVIVLGETRRRKLIVQITKAVSGWLADWSARSDDQNITVQLAPSSEAAQKILSFDLKPGVCGCVSGVEHLWFTVSGGGLNAILNLPGRGNSSRLAARAKIAVNIFERILLSLAEALVVDANLGVWDFRAREISIRDTVADKRNHWVATISWSSSPQHCIEIALSSRLIEQLAPIVNKSLPPIVQKRRTVISEEKVQLEMVLGEASVSVGELASLAINDVIVLSDDLSKSSYLINNKGQRIAQASLGRVENKRAAMVTK